jgi:hypothetical protein
MQKWRKDLRGKHSQREEGKTTGVNQPVHASFNVNNLGIEPSLEDLKIATHFTSLTTSNNNNHKMDLKKHKLQDTTKKQTSQLLSTSVISNCA